MLSARDLTLRRGPEPLVEHVDFTVFRGNKVGLTGANGTGKSSLFAAILGELAPDRGSIEIPSQLSIAHVEQEIGASSRPAIEFVLDGDAQLRKHVVANRCVERGHANRRPPARRLGRDAGAGPRHGGRDGAAEMVTIDGNQTGPVPVVFRMATAYWASQAIYVTAKLGLAVWCRLPGDDEKPCLVTVVKDCRYGHDGIDFGIPHRNRIRDPIFFRTHILFKRF